MAEIESMIHSNGVADDVGWKTVALVDVHARIIGCHQLSCLSPLKPPNAVLAALGVNAASQGTMNNFIWGNEEHQNYETLCGGSGAGIDNQGRGFAGADAVHTHMTNTRLTDPEILESRFPVILERFEVRQGSGGAGQFPGGEGITRILKFLEPMEVNLLTGHREVPPFGLAGGGAGSMRREPTSSPRWAFGTTFGKRSRVPGSRRCHHHAHAGWGRLWASGLLSHLGSTVQSSARTQDRRHIQSSFTCDEL